MADPAITSEFSHTNKTRPTPESQVNNRLTPHNRLRDGSSDDDDENKFVNFGRSGYNKYGTPFIDPYHVLRIEQLTCIAKRDDKDDEEDKKMISLAN